MLELLQLKNNDNEKKDINTVDRPKGCEFNSRPLYLDPLAASVTTVTFYKSRREKIELKDVSSTHDLCEFLFFGQFTGRENNVLKA
jgi:hypothetical protein